VSTLQKKLKVTIFIIVLCVAINLPSAAQTSKERGLGQGIDLPYQMSEGDKSAKEIIKAITDNFAQINDFKGSLISKVILNKDKKIAYQANIMKNQQRSLIDNSYNFNKLEGTEVGRLLNSLPWIYLPPDYSLLQTALPLNGQRDYLKPLANLEDLYTLKLIGEANLNNNPMYLLELNNLFTRQILWVDQEELIIKKIEIFNSNKQLVATINYNDYQELVDNILLPNLIEVKDNQGRKILLITYQNWVLNSGLNYNDFAVGFAPQARREIVKLEKKVNNNPKDDESRYLLSKLYYKILDIEKAIETLKEAIKIDKKVKYYQKLAEIYRGQGKYRKAIKAIEDALIIDYQNGELHFTLGELNLQLNNLEAARDAFETAVSLKPTREEYLERLFWTYRRSSITAAMLNNAQNILDKLIALAPKKPEYLIYSGNLYFDAGKYMQATLRYQQAIQVEPKNTWGYIKLAKSYEKMKEYQLAEQLYKQAINLEPNWLNYEEIADFYYRWQNYEAAVKYYKSALKLKPKQFNLKVKLGKAYWALKDKDEALKVWGGILEVDDLKVNDYLELGQLLTNYKLDNLAVATYQQGIKEFGDSADSWTERVVAKLYANLAKLYEKQSNYQLAVNNYENALELHDYPWIYRKLGVLKLRDGDLATAVKLWKKVKQKDPSDLRAVYNLAVAHLITGEFDKVRINSKYIKRFKPDPTLSKLTTKLTKVVDELERLQENKNNYQTYGKEYKANGDRWRRKGRLNLAMQEYRAALEKNAYYGDAYFYLGMIQSVKQNYQRVEEIISRFDNDYFQQNKAEVLKEIRNLVKEVK